MQLDPHICFGMDFGEAIYSIRYSGFDTSGYGRCNAKDPMLNLHGSAWGQDPS